MVVLFTEKGRDGGRAGLGRNQKVYFGHRSFGTLVRYPSNWSSGRGHICRWTYRHPQRTENIRALGLHGVTQGGSGDAEEERSKGSAAGHSTLINVAEEEELPRSSPLLVWQFCGSGPPAVLGL